MTFPDITPDLIREHVSEKLSDTQIGLIYGISAKAVRRRRERLGVLAALRPGRPPGTSLAFPQTQDRGES